MAVAVGGTPEERRARISSSSPAFSIFSTRRSIRSYRSCRFSKLRPSQTASCFGGSNFVFRLCSEIVSPVSKYTSSARIMRRRSDGCRRAADSGSTSLRRASTGSIPVWFTSASNFSRTPVDGHGANVRPRSRLSAYRPVPPHTMQVLPRDRISCKMGSASSTYFPTEKSSFGLAAPIIWCGTPCISEIVGAAVPISMPR